MQWILKFFSFYIGSCIASHATVVVERFGKSSFVFSRSKCMNCGFTLSLLDELPLLSYLILKGRCRYCKVSIPVEYFAIELIGGFAFYNINFANITSIFTAIVIFCLLLATISDYQKKYFDIRFIFSAIFLAFIRAIKTIPKYDLTDYFQFFPILFLFIFEIARHKLGGGDLLIYLILVFYFTPRFANLTLLTASILLLGLFACHQLKVKESVAFIPFIFLGFVIQLLVYEF